MNNFDIYEDIIKRTDGSMYIGVVGPVRCGKSTFISRFMNLIVLPNITSKFSRERARDELPQSADGKTVMTTQPKFIPNEAVKICLNDTLEMSCRMIDCVGYMVDGAIGADEDERPRMVKTPWSEKEMPFEKAAELGTQKVINDHSTIAILMTTDGTITNIPRSNYVKAEEKVAKELINSGKPFVIVVNSANPTASDTVNLTNSLRQKYNTPAISMDVSNLDENNITRIFEELLTQFPLVSIKVKLPAWLQALPYEDDLIQEIVGEVSHLADNVNKISDFDSEKVLFLDSDKFEPLVVQNIKLGEGKVIFEVVPKPQLFYMVLSNQCGVEIADDFSLISYLRELTHAKSEYDKLKQALEQVQETGYGVVYPNLEEMRLEEPEIVKQGNKSGVRLKASASSLHIMRVDIETEISPIVGTEQQSEELIKYLLAEFETNPQGIWETNMFGKSLHSLVKEGLTNKLTQMPLDVQKKMRKTLSRVINEGKGGIICILL